MWKVNAIISSSVYFSLGNALFAEAIVDPINNNRKFSIFSFFFCFYLSNISILRDRKDSQLIAPNRELFFPPFSSLTHPQNLIFNFLSVRLWSLFSTWKLWLRLEYQKYFHTWDRRWTSGNSIARNAISKTFVTQISNRQPTYSTISAPSARSDKIRFFVLLFTFNCFWA